MTQQERELKNILLQKWKEHQLGHFYIFSNKSYEQDHQHLQQWAESLVINFIGKTDISKLSNHPDLLWIKAKKEDKRYSHLDEDFIQLFKQSNYRPSILSRKIVVIEKSSLISTTLANKMLKLLEDSNDYMLYIFLNPGNRNLLQTIKSRAINLTVKTEGPSIGFLSGLTTDKDFATWADNATKNPPENSDLDIFQTIAPILAQFERGEIGLAACIESLKGEEEKVFQLLSHWATHHCENYLQAKKFLDMISWWQEQKEYHNSKSSRLATLLLNALNPSNGTSHYQ